jgi:SPP1 family predicted phage head-tail adaptor
MLGKMNRLISLYSFTEVVGAGGERTQSDVKIADVYAAMKTTQHPPITRGDKLEFPVTIAFSTHYNAKYSAAREIRFGGRSFAVLSVENIDEANKAVRFRCRENV